VTPGLGNNPLVIAIPRAEGPVVLDMAMSQFSYGTMTQYAKRGAQLPVPGGYDKAGKLTTDPGAIDASQRPLPIGFWKGSGLAMTLDLVAAMLSGDAASPEELTAIADGILGDLQTQTPVDADKPARYPGEQTLHLRRENLELGVPVDSDVWEQLWDELKDG
jgi:3-dehydro-L-gulonate 2-dehydrogenase